MESTVTRRDLIAGSAVAALGGALVSASQTAFGADAAVPEGDPFKHCFNTSTVRGRELPLDQLVEIAAQAGYDAIEPWTSDVESYAQGGGNLNDLRKRIADLGLTVESAIGFAPWIVDDDEKRKQALEQARREMALLRAIGGKRIAAPPSGATNTPGLDLLQAARRYHELAEVGRQEGIVPQIEVWGFSANLSRLGETLLVAVESQHPDACVLLDIYHLYKGGSDFAGLRLLNGGEMHVFHVNDYPADPPRDAIRDAARVYVGDGVAPIGDIFRTLRDIGFRGYLSLELFNPTYWERDPLEVAQTGLEKTKEAVARALG